MQDFNLSPHFTFKEMCSSTWRTEYIARNEEIGASEPYLTYMTTLCETILEPIRKKFMSPVVISSGLRYAEQSQSGKYTGLDVAIRSVRQQNNYDGRSQHTLGKAADIHVVGVPERTVWEWIKDHCPNPFGQCIYEVGGRSVWVHISLPGYKVQSRGGGFLYGECYDAYQDSLGRWCYKLDSKQNRWGSDVKQQWEANRDR